MPSQPRFRRTRRTIAALLVTAVVTTAAVTLALTLARAQTLHAVTASTVPSTSAALLTVTGSGPADTWTSGSPTPAGTEPPSGNEHFRIGSITKTFVATAILQLVDENRIELDAPIETYLPGTVPNGANITIRQILNHTSGLYDYMKGEGWSTNRWRGDARFITYSPDQLLTEAFRHEPYFAPGTDVRYSNTNYIVAGQLIEAVTGRPYSSAIEHRILAPLALMGTSFPGDDASLPEPAVHATASLDGGKEVDVTEQNVSLDWAAGEMVSTTRDLQTFFAALLGGSLISEDSLVQMRTTVPMGMGFHYGLGLERFDLPCGGQLWGHGGQLLGYVTYAYRRDDGRSLTLLLASGRSDGFIPFAAATGAAYCLT
ncbi:D-alanyl-D-alanine carboxypeptidase [Promicromonospora umidemergens]|uniref:Serine hydrolase domain-containing protein n=1 Tax=Promicromonospora umidemergens TaxID=629679 RepID=A0ABP8WJ49_9MICO|nr:serine hydrolase domain-containing protein [Promicromonospora umidemergens]MCP2284088.1 D-alanyl-D-alanine carboxypeptidase [Promicromonospora umidemergens]